MGSSEYIICFLVDIFKSLKGAQHYFYDLKVVWQHVVETSIRVS